MKQNHRLFWSLNCLYWVLHYAVQGSTSPIFLSMEMGYRLQLIGIFLFWIALITGSYRFIYHKLKLYNKTIPFTVVQILVSTCLMMGMDYVCRFYINAYFFDFFQTYLIPPSFTDAAFGRLFSKINDEGDISIFINQLQQNSQWMKFMAYLIWAMAYNFYHISINIRRSAVEKIAAENRAKDLELINLRSQLNPHFLFNALNSIHSLAMMKKDTASDAVLLLSDLMRYTLNYEKRDIVPLSDEIEVVEKYMALEKIRFGKKLNTEIAVAENTLTTKIPPIIVQTLVENAIKHGLKGSIDGVSIKIESYLNDNFLTINVINSGQLQNRDPSVSDLKNSGIGVENTRRRLQMIYGDNACFDLKNRNESEVIATLNLPVV